MAGQDSLAQNIADLRAVPPADRRMRLLGEGPILMQQPTEDAPYEDAPYEDAPTGNLEEKMAALRAAQADTDAHMANAKNKVERAATRWLHGTCHLTT